MGIDHCFDDAVACALCAHCVGGVGSEEHVREVTAPDLAAKNVELKETCRVATFGTRFLQDQEHVKLSTEKLGKTLPKI